MTLKVDVPEELEERLEREAKRAGVSRDEFVRRTLEEKLNLRNGEGKKPPFEAKIIAADLPVKDYSAEREWLRENRDRYAGQWVALDGGRLIAANPDGREVVKEIKEAGLNGLYLTYIEENNQPPFISGGIWRE
jgi:hypothetical protein